MEIVDVFVRVCCAGCAKIFYFCRDHYHGQIYCGGGCRSAAVRESKARDQRSPEGRLDHADRTAASRARAKSVTDTRSNSLAGGASSCVRDDASASAMEAHAVGAQSTDDGTNLSDDAASCLRDAPAGDGGAARVDASGLGPCDGGAPACGGDAAGGAVAVAPAGPLCCNQRVTHANGATPTSETPGSLVTHA